MGEILSKDKQTNFSSHFPAGFLLLVKQDTRLGNCTLPEHAEEAPQQHTPGFPRRLESRAW